METQECQDKKNKLLQKTASKFMDYPEKDHCPLVPLLSQASNELQLPGMRYGLESYRTHSASSGSKNSFQFKCSGSTVAAVAMKT